MSVGTRAALASRLLPWTTGEVQEPIFFVSLTVLSLQLWSALGCCQGTLDFLPSQQEMPCTMGNVESRNMAKN